MPQFKVEYRERSNGVILKTCIFNASDAKAAETEVKRAFTAVQASLGVRQYRILDGAGVVVGAHKTPDEPATNLNRIH